MSGTELKSVYGDNPDDVEKLDLLIGTLAEGHRPTGFGFGETMFQIFILNASRRLQADRFYTDCYNEDVYTSEGLRWIDRTDLKTVILRHYPELADTGLANIKNAFEPWDEGPNLSPQRHPLRAWDAELKHDPWRGDAYPMGKYLREREMLMWFLRRGLWDLIAWLKFTANKPLDILLPPTTAATHQTEADDRGDSRSAAAQRDGLCARQHPQG